MHFLATLDHWFSVPKLFYGLCKWTFQQTAHSKFIIKCWDVPLWIFKILLCLKCHNIIKMNRKYYSYAHPCKRAINATYSIFLRNHIAICFIYAYQSHSVWNSIVPIKCTSNDYFNISINRILCVFLQMKCECYTAPFKYWTFFCKCNMKIDLYILLLF